MKKSLQSKRRGSAIPLVMVAIMILLAMGVGLLDLGMKGRIYSIRTASDIAARCAADAGMTMALYEMNEKLKVKPWNDGSLPEATDESLPYCDAVFSYTVTGNPSDGYAIESVGTSGIAERKVTCILKPQGPFEFAVFAEDGAELKNSALVDWFNFGADDENLKVGTNSIASGAFIFKNSSTINGDVIVGVGGNPDIVIDDFGANITGDTRALRESNVLPPIAVPQWLESLPSSGTIQNNSTVTNSAKYSDINLKNNKTLLIDGDIALYVTGEIILGNSADIEIDNDASLILYLGGDFEGKNSSTINNLTQNAKQLQIYCLDSCENMVFKNSSDFYGVIYAPNAEVIMNNSANLYGAIVAKTFQQMNSGNFNYDASLRDANVNDEAVRFVVTNWHEQ
ncbi:collagen-binding domain-containing protein [Planctomycetota bacterium]